ncbi:G-protein coupled receptor moody [Octopus bimaculoides]|uniref:G-protein coupled receptors family 1 profile domain-containing protein n=1 Tax=Octopus bimaculoides TaxID=37653 RepID=A0A0L8G258_OCTBM|nr:G-protein coupled receptor moody [Octopus bimaculoides]|eukprot:XP_014784765.1 PREDICTED: G-protein coupled receptor moody-like [Octopus bimaculoides]
MARNDPLTHLQSDTKDIEKQNLSSATSSLLLNETELALTYVSVTLIGIIIITGTTGNILVILAVRTSKKLQTPSNIFIVNLSVVNLLFDLGVLPFHAYTNIHKAAGISPLLCRLVALVDYALTGTTIMTIILIAYNRYKLVGNYHRYIDHFNQINIAAMLSVAWLLPLLCLLPPLLEVWGKFGYVERLATCNLFEDKQYFKDILLLLRTLVPSIIIIYFYIGIYQASKASHLRMPSLKDSINSQQRERNEKRMTKMMLTIISLFILFYFPCTITAIIDLYYILSKPHHLFCRLCIYFGSAVNPVIYGLMNSQFSHAYKKLISCRLKKINPNIPPITVIHLSTLITKPSTQLRVTFLSTLPKNTDTNLPNNELHQTLC